MTDEFDVLVDHIRKETGYTGKIAPDDDLLETNVLDSFSVVSLAVFAQEHFGVEFDGDDMIRDNFASLSALTALIRRLRQNRT